MYFLSIKSLLFIVIEIMSRRLAIIINVSFNGTLKNGSNQNSS